ncbi:hypothetical protein D3C79_773470 [compost metagenome]
MVDPSWNGDAGRVSGSMATASPSGAAAGSPRCLVVKARQLDWNACIGLPVRSMNTGCPHASRVRHSFDLRSASSFTPFSSGLDQVIAAICSFTMHSPSRTRSRSSLVARLMLRFCSEVTESSWANRLFQASTLMPSEDSMIDMEYGKALDTPFSWVSARLRLLNRVLKYCGSAGGIDISKGAYTREPTLTLVGSGSRLVRCPLPISPEVTMIWLGSVGYMNSDLSLLRLLAFQRIGIALPGM